MQGDIVWSDKLLCEGEVLRVLPGALRFSERFLGRVIPLRPLTLVG